MSEFVEYLKEVLGVIGPIRSRRMFGGHGVFHNDLMIGLVADDVLYLKGDEKSAEFFTAKGLGQFEYVKNEKTMKMSYYMAPEEIYDDPDEAERWATRAYDAAVRSKKPKKKVARKAAKPS